MSNYPQENLGYIPEIRATDFLAGTLPYQVVVPTGDWRPYLPIGEGQYSQVSDSKGCVSFSNNNVAEIYLKQQGFDFNFSDRFLAKTSNTSINGNSFGVVEDAARHFGRVLESQWPVPDNFTWDTFYAVIPPEVLSQAVFFDEKYEFIGTDIASLLYHLKQAPIQIAIPNPVPNHAVVLVYIQGTTAYYFDSYPGSTNYLKTMPVSDIEAALKLIIKPKLNPMLIYKKIGVATLYFAVGNVLVGYASDFATFSSEFPNATILELSDTEFAKFKVSKLVVKL